MSKIAAEIFDVHSEPKLIELLPQQKSKILLYFVTYNVTSNECIAGNG